MSEEAGSGITDAELTALWRTEQVLHGVARLMLNGKVTEQELGFPRLAVCECAVTTQELAARVQRERLE